MLWSMVDPLGGINESPGSPGGSGSPKQEGPRGPVDPAPGRLRTRGHHQGTKEPLPGGAHLSFPLPKDSDETLNWYAKGTGT